MDLMAAISAVPGIGPAMPYLIAAIALASALAPFIPPDYPFFYRLVNMLASNVGHARNVGDPKVKS